MRIRAGIGTALVALVLTTLPLHTTAAAAPDRARGLEQASERGQERRSERAEAALTAAHEMFAPRGKDDELRARGDAGAAAEAADHPSLVLRDLAVNVDALAPRDQARARAILARPTDDVTDPWPGIKYGAAPVANDCEGAENADPEICLHWVTNSSHRDAPPAAWVARNQEVLAEVWETLVDDLGYRAPRKDAGAPLAGPDGRLDVYLAELGETYGLYGYCAPEWSGGKSAPAYCVIDNDFVEFGGKPLAMLKATAAHEIFHAVQVGYTVFADVWVAEGTAAFIEDEVFDEVNDNLQYLALGPLRYPNAPLDLAPDPSVYGWENFNWRYGSWIWWRYLSESFGPGRADDPRVVREMWNRLANGQRALPALRNTVNARGADFGRVFADFGSVNRYAKQWYAEGRSYRQAPVSQRFPLTRAKRTSGWRSRSVDHLSTQHVLVRSGKGLRGRWRARIELNLPPQVRGSQATVVLERKGGQRAVRRVRLDRRGDARVVVPFDNRKVVAVAISLTNASLRMKDCTTNPKQASPFSCGGWSRDDALAFRYRVTAVR